MPVAPSPLLGHPIGAPRPARARPLRVAALTLLLSLAPAPSGIAEPGDAAYELPENPAELLRLDESMRRYFSSRVPRRAPVERQLDALAAAIVAPDGLGFRYEEGGLYDAREAFRRRGGNCLTFAGLYIAAARECGLHAVFNHVELRPSWGRLGELVIESHHIDVQIVASGRAYEVDLSLPGIPVPARLTARPVTDARAFAGIYGHAGVRKLAGGDHAAALRLLRLATTTDPTAVDAWTNLGNAYLVCNDAAAARAAFGTALRLDSTDLAALSGLARVHRAEGQAALAAPLERKVARFRARNPYYLLFRAETARAAGAAEEAHRLLRRAYDLKADDPEIVARLVASARLQGRDREAARWQRRLAALHEGQTGSSPAGP